MHLNYLTICVETNNTLMQVWACLCLSDFHTCMYVHAWRGCWISWNWTYRQVWVAKCMLEPVLCKCSKCSWLMGQLSSCVNSFKQGKVRYRNVGGHGDSQPCLLFLWSHQEVLPNCAFCACGQMRMEGSPTPQIEGVWVGPADVVESEYLGSWARFQGWSLITSMCW